MDEMTGLGRPYRCDPGLAINRCGRSEVGSKPRVAGAADIIDGSKAREAASVGGPNDSRN